MGISFLRKMKYQKLSQKKVTNSFFALSYEIFRKKDDSI